MERTQLLVAVVNDEVAFVQVLDALLRDEGCATLLLQVGEIAFESIKRQQPDLVILDVSSTQPELSWKVVDLLVLDPATQRIRLIICSPADKAYQEREAKLKELGCALIVKPFAIGELVTYLRAQRQPGRA